MVAIQITPSNTKALRHLSKLFETARNVCVKSAKGMGAWSDEYSKQASPVRSGSLRRGWKFEQRELGFKDVNEVSRTSSGRRRVNKRSMKKLAKSGAPMPAVSVGGGGKEYFYAKYVHGHGQRLLPLKKESKPVFESIARAAMLAHFGEGAGKVWATKPPTPKEVSKRAARKQATAKKRLEKKAAAMQRRDAKRRMHSRSGGKVLPKKLTKQEKDERAKKRQFRKDYKEARRILRDWKVTRG